MSDDGAMAVTQLATGVETHIDIGKDLPTKAPFTVPPEYAEEPWVKDLQKAEDPNAELFKQHKHAQSLIGKKTEGVILPGPESTPEQIKAFRTSIGVPDSAAGYSYTPPVVTGDDKPLWDRLNATRSPAFLQAQKQAAWEEGLTPKQFQNQQEKVERAFIAEFKESQTKNKAKWDETANKYLGARKDEILARRDTMLKQANVPQEVIDGYNSGDPAMRVVAEALVADFQHRTLVKDDKFSQDGVSGAGDRAGLIAKAQELMQSPAYRNAEDPRHDQVVKTVNQMWRDTNPNR